MKSMKPTYEMTDDEVKSAVYNWLASTERGADIKKFFKTDKDHLVPRINAGTVVIAFEKLHNKR